MPRAFSSRIACRSDNGSPASITSIQGRSATLRRTSAADDRRVTINDLAQQLLIKHNSAVELVDRLAKENLVVRQPSAVDRRKVQLQLTGRGRQVLARLAAVHRAELQRIGPVLSRLFNELSRAPEEGA